MEAIIEEIGPANIDRVVNMLGKTNQFNLTTKRHSRAELEALLQKNGAIALALRLCDKFGEQGIIGVLLAIPTNDETTLAIDSFLVSCRALGRGVEDALWATLLRRAGQLGVDRIEAAYIATPRNAIVSGLYDRLGLKPVANSPEAVRYQLEPVKPGVWPSWITDKTARR
jgi:FkbH-like protein